MAQRQCKNVNSLLTILLHKKRDMHAHMCLYNSSCVSCIYESSRDGSYINVYIGKDAASETWENGLGYDVVMKLMQPYLGQGYYLYLDNFYTSTQLLKDLFSHATPSTGTVKLSRKGFPKCLLDAKAWARKGKRGDFRWIRHSPVLAMQWIDSKPVSMLTTLYSANEQVSCKRRTKQRGEYSELTLPQPFAIHEYNQYMNGLDRSDQMLTCHNVSRKCKRWWKTLFFHLIDIAIVNSFILFQRYRAENPDVEAFSRSNRYSIVDFREALIRQILHFQEFDDPPAYETHAPGPWFTCLKCRTLDVIVLYVIRRGGLH